MVFRDCPMRPLEPLARWFVDTRKPFTIGGMWLPVGGSQLLAGYLEEGPGGSQATCPWLARTCEPHSVVDICGLNPTRKNCSVLSVQY